MEHGLHVDDFAHIPLDQVLVERFDMTEHIIHVPVGDLANVPVGQILVPLVHVLVEGTRLTAHGLHVDDFAHVPLDQVLVERFDMT